MEIFPRPGPFKPSQELRCWTMPSETGPGRAGIHGRPCRTQRAGHLPVPEHDAGRRGHDERGALSASMQALARQRAMNQVGQRYADQLANMKDNPLYAAAQRGYSGRHRRVINISPTAPCVAGAGSSGDPCRRAADSHRPVQRALRHDPGRRHRPRAAARATPPSSREPCTSPASCRWASDFLDDCDGRTVILDATKGGNCILDPDAVARQQAVTRICELQREDAEMKQLHSLPDRKRGTANPLSCWPTASARRTSTRPCSLVQRAWGCCAAAI